MENLLLAKLYMNEQQHNSEHKANATDNNVGDAQERILAAQQRGSGYDHALGAFKFRHRIVWNKRKCKISFFKKFEWNTYCIRRTTCSCPWLRPLHRIFASDWHDGTISERWATLRCASKRWDLRSVEQIWVKLSFYVGCPKYLIFYCCLLTFINWFI